MRKRIISISSSILSRSYGRTSKLICSRKLATFFLSFFICCPRLKCSCCCSYLMRTSTSLTSAAIISGTPSRLPNALSLLYRKWHLMMLR
jgi:hypothetical protein